MLLFATVPYICIILTALLIIAFFKWMMTVSIIYGKDKLFFPGIDIPCLFVSSIILGLGLGHSYKNGMPWLVPVMIFMTHFWIDKFSLAKYLLKVKGMDITRTDALYWIVYVVADNTLHLVLMMAGLRYLFGVRF
jgi:hypothetical protein